MEIDFIRLAIIRQFSFESIIIAFLRSTFYFKVPLSSSSS